PYLEGDTTVYLSARAMYGEDPKTLVHSTAYVGSRPCPYNVAALEHARAAGYVLMLEGEKDTAAALAALGVDAPAVGLMGGTMPGASWHERIAQLGVPAVVCFDRDDAGQAKAAKLAAALRAAGCADVRLVSIPSPHKDAADVLAADGPDALRAALAAWQDTAAPPEVRARDVARSPQGTADTLAPKVDDALTWYPDTDAGNAERFVHYTRGTVRYAPGLGWLLWRGTHWERDPSELVLRFALEAIRATHATSVLLDNPERRASLGKHARASEALGRLRSMLDLARVSPPAHVLPNDLDADPWMLNTLTGLVDLRTATQRPHDPAALCTKIAPAAFDLDAD
ncbi:MAG: toprim domain-containing protein, partial [Trueperaceae bacterium]|nr:toprim domain-containing protein [Trueperaceae bacterium]